MVNGLEASLYQPAFKNLCALILVDDDDYLDSVLFRTIQDIDKFFKLLIIL